ncbi:MAG: hypothetical protein RLZZ58_1068 [Pseudomonadota bacterium]
MRAATFPVGFYELTEGYFTSEAEAFAEIEAMGWHAYAQDRVMTNDEELHWHDFEAVTFVVSGMLRVADEQGVVIEAGPGTRAQTGAGYLHRELAGAPHRLVFGFPIDPSEFTMPLNKPPELLATLKA